MIESYCFVGGFLKIHPALAYRRPSPQAQPHFSDAEVLTIALLPGVLEVATPKQTYRLVARNWGECLSVLADLQACGPGCLLVAPHRAVVGRHLGAYAHRRAEELSTSSLTVELGWGRTTVYVLGSCEHLQQDEFDIFASLIY